MLTARVNGDDGKNYDRYYIVMGINDETLSRAKNIFEDYRKGGVILNESFYDAEWLLTNQVKRITLRFYSNELSFKKHTEKWIGCSYPCFVDGVKAYTIFHMGIMALSGIWRIVNKLMCLTEQPCGSLPPEMHLIDFLKLLPDSETKDQVIEDLEERTLFNHQTRNRGKQRILSEFNAYFKFNDALEDFWSSAGEQDKLFYFPLYFWWTLTAILPLRPTEFLLIPRQCIEKKNGENILTVRRTTLKGGQGKIHYNINGDYTLVKYSVPDKMITAIERYMKATADMPASSLNTLFVQQPHYSHLNKSAPLSGVYYYSYCNLQCCLRKFQDKIMEIESDKDRINLGDTRHLAMISLIASGGSPVICKELAGHGDINISSHYYSNISRFVECATYEMYQKQKGYSVEMLNHKSLMGESVEVAGGRCDSSAYISGSISDCIRNIGTDGELGHCISCPHFIDGKTGKYLLFSNADERKNQVDADSKYLMHVLEMVRKGNGCNEDIQSALLKLQHSSTQYCQYIYRNMEGL